MPQSVEFDRLEQYAHPPNSQEENPYIVCSFKTNRFGYYQVKHRDSELIQLDQEPSLRMFSDNKLNYMRRVCAIVYRLTYDAPAAKRRFQR